MTALLEAEALFMTADGQLRGTPRDPDLILTIDKRRSHRRLSSWAKLLVPALD
jgi:hypothetical protein